ncbi:hypothetical protein [Paraburkholderia sp. D1E]|uniref:hypothetical protein n=1 Tax=Paraburkholderia sp. D1E TaxID=3461398 RepID=UPI0040460D43
MSKPAIYARSHARVSPESTNNHGSRAVHSDASFHPGSDFKKLLTCHCPEKHNDSEYNKAINFVKKGKGTGMALTKEQQQVIDGLIFKNWKAIDIIGELVGKHGANARDVRDYLDENKTLQGMLKTITHRSKDVARAGDEATRTEAVKEIEKLSKRAIKVLQQRKDDSA